MKKLLILYGEQNAGKTSTLRSVFESLTGYLLTDDDPQVDLRVVFRVGRKRVFLATLGDTANVMKTNFKFFSSQMHGNTKVYELVDGQLVKIDQKRLQQLHADVCVTACRIYKDGQPNTTLNMLNKLILEVMPVTDGIIWLPKQQSDEPKKKLKRTVNNDHDTALSMIAGIKRKL